MIYFNDFFFLLLTAKTKEAPAPAPPEGEMSILVTIDKPEIILIEDQSNFSSSALILDVSIVLILSQDS